ncbi:MAG: hypothetical protein V3T65_06915 [Acidobacteriota bacterium]
MYSDWHHHHAYGTGDYFGQQHGLGVAPVIVAGAGVVASQIPCIYLPFGVKIPPGCKDTKKEAEAAGASPADVEEIMEVYDPNNPRHVAMVRLAEEMRRQVAAGGTPRIIEGPGGIPVIAPERVSTTAARLTLPLLAAAGAALYFIAR